MKYSAFLIKLSASLLNVAVHLDLKTCVCSALGSFTFNHANFFSLPDNSPVYTLHKGAIYVQQFCCVFDNLKTGSPNK